MENPNFQMSGEMFEPRFYRLVQRQRGLEDQARRKGFKGARVYDERVEASLGSLPMARNPDEVWYAGQPYGDYPFYEGKYVASGYVPGFQYCCCGELESDPEFVLISSGKENQLDSMCERLFRKGASAVYGGRQINVPKALEYLVARRNQRVAEQVKGFYDLPKDEQQRVLGQLLSHYGLERK
jgi:hypothetical protein